MLVFSACLWLCSVFYSTIAVHNKDEEQSKWHMYDKVLNDQQKRQMFSHFDFYYDVRFAIVYTVIAMHTHAQITETQ